MNNEFKSKNFKDTTVYTLESATSGGTSAGGIASVSKPLGKDSIIVQSRMGPKEIPASKPRNFVAKNAKMGGAGAHKDKKKAEKQGDVKHKARELDMAEEASPMIKPPTNRFDNKHEAFAYAREHGGKVFKSTYIDPNTGNKNINFVVKKEEGVAEGAPELLKKEMPTHRYAEKLLAQNGVSKDDPDYYHHLNNTIKHLRQFGNIDLINKGDEQGVAEEVESMFDIVEELVMEIAETHNIDPEQIWEDLADVSDEELYESAAWRRKEGKDPKGGLNRKGIMSYRREHPGSKLSMAVTTKPSKLKPGSKAANRRKSFCARMGGMKGPMRKNGKPTRKALALRKWNC